jgi:hypothetical protein
MAFSAIPPVFYGPEYMNGLRSRDELMLWEHVLDGSYGPPPDSFVVAGNSNLDPVNGDGNSAAMRAFLTRPNIRDPQVRTTNADWGMKAPESCGSATFCNRPTGVSSALQRCALRQILLPTGERRLSLGCTALSWWISVGSPANMTSRNSVGTNAGSKRSNFAALI